MSYDGRKVETVDELVEWMRDVIERIAAHFKHNASRKEWSNLANEIDVDLHTSWRSRDEIREVMRSLRGCALTFRRDEFMLGVVRLDLMRAVRGLLEDDLEVDRE